MEKFEKATNISSLNGVHSKVELHDELIDTTRISNEEIYAKLNDVEEMLNKIMAIVDKN